MKGTLPRLECHRWEFGELAADVNAPPWNQIAPVFLSDAVTGAKPKQGTEVRAGWDSRGWRVLFHAADADAWATLTQRDAPLYKEETVEIFFDTTGDLNSYFEIEVNPLGTEFDSVFRRNRSGYTGDDSWTCDGLQTRVRRGPDAWTVEIAVPFAAVTNAPPKPGAEWRVNFCRIDRPSRDHSIPWELSAWSPPGRPNFHTQERFGIVVFSP